METEYWGGTLYGEPPRLDLSKVEDPRAAFDEAARAGKVIIIENATHGTALGGWSCQKLADELPGARMRREYDWDSNPEDENIQNMGDADWAEATEEGEDAHIRKQQDPKSPPFAPFYWGVREYQGGGVGDRATIQKIRSLIRNSVPRFMDPRQKENLAIATDALNQPPRCLVSSTRTPSHS